jgi:geranylgeranyl transferase type-2 subunit beta
VNPTYLQQLTIRVSAGMGCLSDAQRQKHIDYLIANQQSDGGFGGRMGGSDLYYTGFALRALAVTGALEGVVAEKAAGFVSARLQGRETIIDFLSLIYGAMLLQSAAGIDPMESLPATWRSEVAQTFSALRRSDGGFAKSPLGQASSTYHTFLVMICLELLEQSVPEPDKIVSFIKSQQFADGGFREIRVAKRAGTNPTAAAIGSLKMLDALDAETRETTIDFLCEMQNDEGGLLASEVAPVADGLSTFTGLVTLIDLDAANEINLPAIHRFASGLELAAGGFAAASFDLAGDVEYTFYGLGTLGLLASM